MKHFLIFIFCAFMFQSNVNAVDSVVKPRDDNILQPQNDNNTQTNNCLNLNNKIVLHGSEIFFVKQCVLHPVLDTQIYNHIISTTNFAPIEISTFQYANLKLGTPYTEENFAREFNIQVNCSLYNQNIVSSDNISFYYIENCKKRKFPNSHDVELFRDKNNVGATVAIADFELNQIERGRLMSVQKEKTIPEKTALELLRTRQSLATTCKQIQTKAATPYMAYYGSIFYLQNCVLHPILNLKIETMEEVDYVGGIYALSTQEILTIPQGAPWNNKN